MSLSIDLNLNMSKAIASLSFLLRTRQKNPMFISRAYSGVSRPPRPPPLPGRFDTLYFLGCASLGVYFGNLLYKATKGGQSFINPPGTMGLHVEDKGKKSPLLGEGEQKTG